VETLATPEDLVTMNTKVRLEALPREKQRTATLVYPDDVDLASDGVSILAPLDTALLGSKVGDAVQCAAERGAHRFSSFRLQIGDLALQFLAVDGRKQSQQWVQNAIHCGTVELVGNAVICGKSEFFYLAGRRPRFPAEPFEPTAREWSVARYRNSAGLWAHDRYSFPRFVSTLAGLRRA